MNVCGHHPTSSGGTCPRDSSGATDQACLVFKDPDPADQAFADDLGVCVKKDLCLAAKASLPGGVFCVDGTGTEL